MNSKVPFLLGSLLLSGLMPFLSEANDSQGSLKVEIPVKALLSPTQGYEEKNNVQVVLYGYLPNACYTLAESQIIGNKENSANETLEVRQYAIKQTNGVCAEELSMPQFMRMKVPFTHEVSVGRLPAGNYKILFRTQDNSTGTRTLSVSQNVTPMEDTLPYAMVSNTMTPDVVNGIDDIEVTISGVLNSTCTTLNENVRVMDQGDVLVVLPTIQVQKGIVCAQALIPFEKKVNLGRRTPGLHLIHTRSMNGKAINRVIRVAR